MLGAFYTPAWLVESLTRTALEPLLGGERLPTVCDPACGDGRFLVEAHKQIVAATGADPVTVAEECLFGMDIDRKAVSVARDAVVEAACDNCHVRGTVQRNVRAGDGLLDPFGRSFDLVLGNPPWLSHSGRHAVPIDNARREQLEAKYGTDGWLATHTMFVLRAAEGLGSRLAFVLPAQVAQLDGYGHLRAVVAERLGVDELCMLGEDVFDDVTSPVITLVAGGPAPRGLVRDVAGTVTATIDPRAETWHVSRHVPVAGEAFENGRASWSLGDLVADIGVHTGNCAGRLIVDGACSDAGAEPLLEGRDIVRYGCTGPRRYLRATYRPCDGEYCTVRPRSAYERVCFAIRQTAAYPIVGPCVGAAYFRNSLLALRTPAPEQGVSIEFVAGVLNSNAMREIYASLCSDAAQRTFPQVKIGTLRRLPMPSVERTNPRDVVIHDELSALVSQLIELRAKDVQLDTGAEAFERLDARVDELVRELIA